MSISIVDLGCLETFRRDPRVRRQSPSTPIDPRSFAAAIAEHLADKPAVAAAAKALLGAFRNVGFTYVSNHGVDAALEAAMDAKARAFFRRPDAEKQAIDMIKGGRAWRGFFAVGSELTSGKPDIKEGIYFGQQIAASDPRNGRPLFGQNLYPAADGDGSGVAWADLVEEYMRQCEASGQGMMVLIALGLGLPGDAFVTLGATSDPLGLFRIFHYPPPATLADPRLQEAALWGVGEHTDYGLLTLLRQDTVGGLEVRARGGQWVAATPIPGTLVVNAGDFLECLTGGLLLSTPHRVRNPDPAAMRISFPYFFDPSMSFVIRPVPLSPALRAEAAAAIEERRRIGWGRWDAETRAAGGPQEAVVATVDAIVGGEAGLTYSTYLQRKVSRVFPMLASSQL